MKKVVFLIVFLSLFLIPGFEAAAQDAHNSPSTSIFDTSGLPQWAKDLRRWDIVAFGSFPFSMFLSNFFYDIGRWKKAGWENRQYAPWPIASAGAVEKDNKQFRNTVLIAAGISATVAFADLLIVKMKQRKVQRTESRPTGSYTINRTPNERAEADDEDIYKIEAGVTVDKENIEDESDIFDMMPTDPNEDFLE